MLAKPIHDVLSKNHKLVKSDLKTCAQSMEIIKQRYKYYRLEAVQKNKGMFVQCVSKILYHKMMHTINARAQLMKVDSAASGFK